MATNRTVGAFAALMLLLILAACAPQAGPGLALGAAPWSDGEVAKYDIIDKNGSKVGTEDISYSRSENVWLITVVDKVGTLDQTAKVRVDAATLKPLGEEKTIKAQGTDATISTTYQGGKLEIRAVVNGENRSATVDVPSDALDNDQLLATLRALQFAEDYVGKYVNVVAANATKINTTVRVQAREKVEVPAGSFDTWKLELEFGQVKQHAWYQVATPNQLVQYDNGATKMVLTK